MVEVPRSVRIRDSNCSSWKRRGVRDSQLADLFDRECEILFARLIRLYEAAQVCM